MNENKSMTSDYHFLKDLLHIETLQNEEKLL